MYYLCEECYKPIVVQDCILIELGIKANFAGTTNKSDLQTCSQNRNSLVRRGLTIRSHSWGPEITACYLWGPRLS